MKTFFATLLIALVSLSVIAGNESDNLVNAPISAVKGVVLDKHTGETLSGVVIHIETTDTKVYSDKNGEFSLEGLKPGTYTLTVSCISYKNQEVQVTMGTPSADAISVKLESVEP
jgi:hypothetical protein